MLPAVGDHEATRVWTGCSAAPLPVFSSTLQGPFDWPGATVASGDAMEIVRGLPTHPPRLAGWLTRPLQSRSRAEMRMSCRCSARLKSVNERDWQPSETWRESP